MSLRLFLYWRDRLLAETLVEALHRQPGLVLIGCTDRISRAVLHLRRHPAEVVLLQAHGPATPAEVARLAQQVPRCPVLAFGLRTARAAVRLLEAGGGGYVRRDAPFAHLVHSIHALAEGRPLCDLDVEWLAQARIARLHRRLDGETPGGDLTPRETEVLTQLDRGLTNKEVAHRLAIRPATVKNHVHNLVRKLGVSNRREAVRLAHAQGLLG